MTKITSASTNELVARFLDGALRRQLVKGVPDRPAIRAADPPFELDDQLVYSLISAQRGIVLFPPNEGEKSPDHLCGSSPGSRPGIPHSPQVPECDTMSREIETGEQRE